MMQEKDYEERCRDELNISQIEQDQTHDLYEKEGKEPPPLDANIFSVSESVLKHRLAVLPEELLEQLITLCARKWDPSYEGLELLCVDSESHEPTHNIPPDRKKKKEPQDKTKIAVVPTPPAWLREGPSK